MHVSRYHKTLAVVMLAVMLSLGACASLPDTPEKGYMVANEEFTKTLKKYNDYYDAATPEQQAKWKEQIDPLITDADTALKVWKVAITDPMADPVEAENKYLILKNKMFKMLAAHVFNEQ